MTKIPVVCCIGWMIIASVCTNGERRCRDMIARTPSISVQTYETVNHNTREKLKSKATSPETRVNNECTKIRTAEERRQCLNLLIPFGNIRGVLSVDPRVNLLYPRRTLTSPPWNSPELVCTECSQIEDTY